MCEGYKCSTYCVLLLRAAPDFICYRGTETDGFRELARKGRDVPGARLGVTDSYKCGWCLI